MPARPETQQNVARIVLKTFCEAWLEHIRSRRMKFRYTMGENPSISLILNLREILKLDFRVHAIWSARFIERTLYRAHALLSTRFIERTL